MTAENLNLALVILAFMAGVAWVAFREEEP